MIHGTIDKTGEVVIRFNIQYDRLMLPNGNQFLPCETCGAIVEVNHLAVSVICPNCHSADDGRLALDTPERKDQERCFGEGQEPEQEDDNG